MTGFETRTGVPAAWYPDPQGPPLLRWWDGSGWTPQTMDPRSAAPTASDESVSVPVDSAVEGSAARIVEPIRRPTCRWPGLRRRLHGARPTSRFHRTPAARRRAPSGFSRCTR
ncbi:DUF2510 domain-containing protein [Conyzicola nivalis]|uniref:DUF2510 domain-containing protein n=1 Tax=Conyzicola nivalis TaxID=1477021 RepID=UPI0033923C89